MKIRCVVTGRDASGKSIVAEDSAREPITVGMLPGFAFHRVWGADGIPALPSDGTPPPYRRYFPPAGGFRFWYFTLPAHSDKLPTLEDQAAAYREMEEKLPGVAEFMEPGHPGMHTTDTVDLDVILSGEVYLELDGGTEVLLRAGDCVVQNGTRHAWHNRSERECVIACALVGGCVVKG